MIMMFKYLNSSGGGRSGRSGRSGRGGGLLSFKVLDGSGAHVLHHRGLAAGKRLLREGLNAQSGRIADAEVARDSHDGLGGGVEAQVVLVLANVELDL
jgi:hypothetical protein